MDVGAPAEGRPTAPTEIRPIEPGVPATFPDASRRGVAPVGGGSASAPSAHDMARTSARSAAAATLGEATAATSARASPSTVPFALPRLPPPTPPPLPLPLPLAEGASTHASSCSHMRRRSLRALACCAAAALPRPTRRSWLTMAPPARVPAALEAACCRNRGGDALFHVTFARPSSSIWLRRNPSGRRASSGDSSAPG